MIDFKFSQVGLEGAFVIDGLYLEDIRGGFTKLFERRVFEEAGITFRLSETFASVSAQNVIRGLHFQTNNPQGKLICVLKGKVWDVIVDLRPESHSFKKWEAVELSADNHRSLYVPKGFAHGFASLEEGTVMLYQCDGIYDEASDTGIRYDDKEINIIWPIADDKAIHSQRDLQLGSFSEYMLHPMTQQI